LAISNELRLLCVPFHNGLRNVSMGKGAFTLESDEELRVSIEARGWRVTTEEIEAVDQSLPENARVMELDRRLASRAREAVDDGAFPLVLAGNCNSCLGTAAGVGTAGLGVVWFDAHADFDDPEENTSGFFDVMGLAMLTGRGWRGLRQTVPGLTRSRTARDPCRGPRSRVVSGLRLEQSEVLAIPDAIDFERFGQAVAELAARASRIYLHVELDSIDIRDARANRYAAGGGPSLDRLVECLDLVCRRFDVAAASITAYDPVFDEDGRALTAARRVVRKIAHGVQSKDNA
jgi:arginase